MTVAEACSVLDAGATQAAIVVAAHAPTGEPLASAVRSGHDVVLVAGRELEPDEISAAVASGAAAVIAFTVERDLARALARAVAHLAGRR
jgi:hypothetical protein